VVQRMVAAVVGEGYQAPAGELSIALWPWNCRKGQHQKSEHLRPRRLIPARAPPLRLLNAKPAGSCFCAPQVVWAVEIERWWAHLREAHQAGTFLYAFAALIVAGTKS
jgi:hypothetical protein